jgi:hypothetical protein
MKKVFMGSEKSSQFLSLYEIPNRELSDDSEKIFFTRIATMKTPIKDDS